VTADLPSEFTLNSRIALVTGGSRGLGVAIARGLVRHGATVVLSARKEPDLQEAVAELESIRPGSASYVASHAGREEEIAALVATVMERHGRVELLVNNAGTNPYFGPLIDADVAAWDKTFEVNLRGYFLLTQACWRAWMRDHGGAVLNVASTAGVRPSPMMGVYGITKAGVIMLTRQLASELGGKVRVNCVAPGVFRTRFAKTLWSNPEIMERVLARNPTGRIGEPEELAGTAVYLLSDAARYVNGQTIVVDGGGDASG
jgi:NAD(P)-dependent dehydrogenase (short-subunit alcohol dehydrogenase family)